MGGLYLAALFGFIGGLTRAFVGLLKYKQIPKAKRKFRIDYLFFTLIASGVIGIFCGLLVATEFKLSLLAGYAGTDFIESIYKIKRKQKITI